MTNEILSWRLRSLNQTMSAALGLPRSWVTWWVSFGRQTAELDINDGRAGLNESNIHMSPPMECLIVR